MPVDRYAAFSRAPSLPATSVQEIVPDDAADIDHVSLALNVATPGNVRVTTLDGDVIPLEIDTLCVHGDTPNAPRIAQQLREALESAGVEVRAFV